MLENNRKSVNKAEVSRLVFFYELCLCFFGCFASAEQAAVMEKHCHSVTDGIRLVFMLY